MIFSTRSEYAIRALSELVLMNQDAADHADRRTGFVMFDHLIERSALPYGLLARIFCQLVKAGILQSAKGPGGGFALARPPQNISLLDIVEATDDRHRLDGCVVGLAKCNDSMLCPQHALFKPLRQRIRSYLATTTLAENA